MSSKRVVVIGGGIAGLSVSLELLELAPKVPGGLEVVCLEENASPGGNIRTIAEDGFLVEWGPNGFLDNVPATLELASRLGLQSRLLPSAPAANNRFIFRKGRLRKLPSGALSFLGSRVLSPTGKLRVLCEPFGPKPPREGDESVFDFARRRIGREAARLLVGAMVTGIYAGDARQLSLQATFPKMWQMENEFGSLTRAMLQKRKQARKSGAKSGGPAGPGGRLTSFRSGLEELIRALGEALGPALRTKARANGVFHEDLPAGSSPNYRVEVAGHDPLAASAVVLACPAWSASGLTLGLDPDLSRILSEIPSAALAVVHIGFEESRLRESPNGFGFLVPRGEGPRILGAIWASSVFEGRAPDGKVLLTVMVGGAHDPKATALNDDEILSLVRNDLKLTMGIETEPCFVRIFRHPRGIPQYVLGHGERLQAAEQCLRLHPGLFLMGNSYRGISVNNCVEEAPRIACEVLDHLKKDPI